MNQNLQSAQEIRQPIKNTFKQIVEGALKKASINLKTKYLAIVKIEIKHTFDNEDQKEINKL
ncbi:hypothetical protein BCD_1539 (plasmid) [Borrelia crocidurae DOU]|uniref:Uncharacterized protein n=1 Tax=Borrelia crocidurae DOU TaxID=1293575 RepID=W5SL38_9SPIR|nr:hypothetical protein BCD_1539 [Borrelia crocidurae DOU]